MQVNCAPAPRRQPWGRPKWGTVQLALLGGEAPFSPTACNHPTTATTAPAHFKLVRFGSSALPPFHSVLCAWRVSHLYQPSAPRPSDPSGKHPFSSCPPNLFHMHLAHAPLHVLPTHSLFHLHLAHASPVPSTCSSVHQAPFLYDLFATHSACSHAAPKLCCCAVAAATR